MAVIQYQLVVQAGPTPALVYELSLPVMHIGREPANDIAINDLEVSRRHARLTVQPGGYIIEDLGSTNGTFVNGQRLIGPHLLRAGEQVALGEKILLSYEATQLAAEGTMISPADQPHTQLPATAVQSQAPAQSYRSPASSRPAPTAQPTYYSGQIPESPPVYASPAAPSKSNTTLIVLGVGCLVVFLCVCVGSALIFDTLNLYCIPPFNSTFAWLYACP